MVVKQQQQGMALVIALMLFALLAALTTEVMFRQDRFLTRADNLLQWDKRYQYAMAAEVVAVQGLIDDLEDDRKNGNKVDDCVEELWAVDLPPTPYEDAILTASVQDLQGRFNLNWLIRISDTQLQRDNERRDQLAHLLGLSLPEPGDADLLANEMADWLDSNNIVDAPQGAEDPEYRFRRTPNMPAAHESELRGLRSFSVEDEFSDPALWGLFTALPVGTTLNVNTAPSPVLEAVVGRTAGDAAVQAIIQKRRSKPISDIQALLQESAFEDMKAEQKEALSSMLGVSSEYFQVMVDVEVDGQRSRLVSRVRRSAAEGEGTHVFSREVQPLMAPLEPACNPFYNGEETE